MENHATNICPYLGLGDDPTTPVGYPSTRNVCYQSKKHENPSLNYQRSTCLTDRFINCPVYNAEVKGKLPRSIRHRSKKSFDLSNKLLYIVLFFVIIIGLGTVMLFNGQWVSKINQVLIPSWQKTHQVRTNQELPTAPVTKIPDQDAVESVEPNRTPSSTSTQTPSATATTFASPPILALDTPIGGETKFIIHRARQGESLFQYAREQNTNVDAIRAVNYGLPAVLYVDWIVVIPIDVDDPAGLPAFEAFEVTMRGRTVEALAEELAVIPEDLSKYNNVPMDYKFSPGEWILVPRE